MSARAIQICGTGSGVGKSVIVAGLCRIFLQDGFKVAPFKAQNMSLNSFVTLEGGEIGRAQALQAMACRLNPSVDMNPILLKPNSDTGSQVIVKGRPVGNMSALRYKNYKNKAGKVAQDSFDRLKKDFEIIVIEGAGSPAEINLKSHDIVNMNMAKYASAPVLLVGDIDRGGVFAWLLGTWQLLTPLERKRVMGFIINKFRGDKRLLKPGLDFLEKRSGIKVLGVIPYFKDIKIPQEDSLSLDAKAGRKSGVLKNRGLLDIAVIKLPHISNFTDFDPLENEPDVALRYVEEFDELGLADIIIVPGTKNTLADLLWLKKSGIAGQIIRTIRQEPLTMLIGICGGYQMLGEEIQDLNGVESKGSKIRGLGMFPVATVFRKDKVLAQVKARGIASGLDVFGYEIHHGRTQAKGKFSAAFKILERQGKVVDETDGAVSKDGLAWGTYIHGIFDADSFRRNILNQVRLKKGCQPLTNPSPLNLEQELDKLADVLRNNLDMASLRKILFAKHK